MATSTSSTTASRNRVRGQADRTGTLMWFGSSELDATSASIGVNSIALLWLTTVTSMRGIRGRSRSSWRAVLTPAKPPPRMTTRYGGARPWPSTDQASGSMYLVAASWNRSPASEPSRRTPRRLGSCAPASAPDHATAPLTRRGMTVRDMTPHRTMPMSRPPVSARAWLRGRCRNAAAASQERPVSAAARRPRRLPWPARAVSVARRAGRACRPVRTPPSAVPR
ncbi:MAG TPA: hypothetical protein VEP73_07390, partial [Actinomycetota bacterium]|nr:hypothetical protein [Actinomycetota bacterium]